MMRKMLLLLILALWSISNCLALNYPAMVYSTPSSLVPGLSYQHAQHPGTQKWEIDILKVNLIKAKVELRPILPKTGKKSPVTDISSEQGAIAAINGSYFDGAGNLLSLTKIDGETISRPVGTRPARSCLGILSDRTLTIQPIAPDLISESGYDWSQTLHGIGGGPQLLKSGVVSITTTEEGFDDRSGIGPVIRNPRTALGFNNKGEVFMVTVDGRQPDWSVGMTLTEMALLLQDLGATEAINFDGGGSTTMVIGNKLINRPSNMGNLQRPVANALAILPLAQAVTK